MSGAGRRGRAILGAEETLPREGQLVEVRGQNWVVSDVVLPVAGTTGGPGGEARVQAGSGGPAAPRRGHTLVRLQSVADGRYGETLSVIWEVEPGRRIRAASSLPDAGAGRFDPPEQLAAFLDAIRWSAVASADTRTLQSPFRSGVAVEPYQLEPVARAVGAPRVNLLLADDVGLGKTIEAGLVAQELLLRGRAHRIMVVCPAGLTVKWRDELAEKFGFEFTVVDSDRCAELRRSHGTAANPFRVYPHTIVSLPWLRGPKAQRLLDEVVPERTAEAAEAARDGEGRRKRFFDLLILDEAHHVAPAAPKQVYAVDSQQTRLIRRLVPHFEHRLFLSATPHNGYPESYTALLELIDDQRFARGVDPDREALRDTVVRRLKTAVTRRDGGRFRERRNEGIRVDYTDEEREIHELLVHFAEVRRRQLAPNAATGRKAADLVTLLLKKRLFSSPDAFRRTIDVYLAGLEEAGHRGRSSAAAAAGVDQWFDDYADYIAELDDEQLAETEETALTLSARVLPGLEDDEAGLLRRMGQWATRYEAAPDSKATALLHYLAGVCRDGNGWTRERVVIFTEYRDTQKWLHTLIGSTDLGGDPGRVALLHGGLTADEREHIRLGFQADPGSPEGKVRVLIATDAASEGIDLQKHCHRLVNYDIPFNPNKLEQRIGRIDRWGQRKDPDIRHFIGAHSETAAPGSYEADLEFLARVAKKVARMEEDLGGVNAVLADAVQRWMTGDRRPVDIENAKPRAIKGRTTGGTVAAEQNVTAQVRRLSEAYEQTIDTLGLTPSNIKRVVDTALSLDRQQELTAVRKTDALTLDGVADTGELDLSGALFTVPPLTGTWERATRGLAHKLRPDEQRPVTFDARVAAEGRDDVVLAHLGHPLVDRSLRLLRAAVWQADVVGLHRVAAVVSDDPALETTLVSAYARYVLVGADGIRLHEEILYAGGWFGDTGRFRRWNSVNAQGKVLHRALTEGVQAAEHLRAAVGDSWHRLQDPLFDSLKARARERHDGLRNALAQRQEEEEKRVRHTFERFAATLRDKLREEGDREGEQFALFGEREASPAELKQYQEDKARWRARLDSLDGERERELAAVADRYREQRDHVFPVAVVFVIPRKEAMR
ncbi:DISARM system SNF2-like helicase DrmD [Yinghuangia sp. ASG 101]|uniref:DISARM system SNF2-like helicase DrmD n=1 Tax=Yinghuangia sp. ASG 101 TaxID=2896848 RepID=UPI003FCCEBDB